jgi:hypothetical protein
MGLAAALGVGLILISGSFVVGLLGARNDSAALMLVFVMAFMGLILAVVIREFRGALRETRR